MDLLGPLLLLLPVLAAGIDRVHPAAARLVFGSCQAQEVGGADIWNAIAATDPDVFVWMGDVEYAYPLPSANETFGESLTRKLGEFKRSPEYSSFLNASGKPVTVIGTYDDHDFGSLGWPNDAGKESPWKRHAQQELLTFLGEPEDSPLRLREGAYSSHLFASPSPSPSGKTARGPELLVLVLDTRFHRDPHYVPSLGTWTVFGRKIPGNALAACVVRMICAAFGLSRDYDGDVLGEEQWRWLDQQLRESEADATIIVSSVQVLSTTPMVESWGHFPRSKARLLDLLDHHQPNGLVFLSGDVHYAETSVAKAGPFESGDLVEVTSSSLTHACGNLTPSVFSYVQRLICYLTHWAFYESRLEGTQPFMDNNFAVVDLDWGSEEPVRVSVRDRRGRAVEGIGVAQGRLPARVPAEAARLHTHGGARTLQATGALAAAGLAVFGAPLLLVGWLLSRVRRVLAWKPVREE